MSFAVSPSPSPLSGSLLVIETSWKVGLGSHTSATDTVALMVCILWFGGHSTVRSSTTEIVGGWVSWTVTVREQLEALPAPSVAVNVIVVVAPVAKHAGGAECVITGAVGQLSVAVAPFRNVWIAGSDTATPPAAPQ